MDPNLRMSTVRPTPNPKARAKKEEEDNYLVLAPKVIADCINDLGMMEISVVDIQTPQPQVIQRIYEYFVEVAMNVVREVVAPAMKAAAEDIGGQYSEVYAPDTLDLLGLFVNLRKLFSVCGIDDFQMQDLFRPTPDRVIKQCSHIMNFLRFRESQQSTTSAYFDKAERTKHRIQTLYTETQSQRTHLATLDRNRKATESQIRDKESRAEDLKRQMLDLKRAADRTAERFDRGRAEATKMKATLEDKITRTQLLKQEAAKLRPYATQSRDALETALDDLRAALADSRAQIETLERRSRALQASTDAFTTVTADIDGVTSLLRDLERDLAAEEAALAEAARSRDALAERTNGVRDVDRRERQLTKQLENTRAKTETLRGRAEERRAFAARRMEEIMRVDEELRRERAVSEREMERRRARIDQTEKKMADLKETIENEIHGARDEFLKLDSHVHLYVKEMTQSIMG